jgi:hypothetical protein
MCSDDTSFFFLFRTVQPVRTVLTDLDLYFVPQASLSQRRADSAQHPSYPPHAEARLRSCAPTHVESVDDRVPCRMVTPAQFEMARLHLDARCGGIPFELGPEA